MALPLPPTGQVRSLSLVFFFHYGIPLTFFWVCILPIHHVKGFFGLVQHVRDQEHATTPRLMNPTIITSSCLFCREGDWDVGKGIRKSPLSIEMPIPAS